ncbi:myelin and lymphocyte protein-like [Carassius carassius]|uniref:myelin and lymphocyte protein-like n=1 Tax=Carassius carassius TaxID=217509 RepID=UPI0028686181|nr:myelin and lymphocyte protein-like [Carassius carassius]
MAAETQQMSSLPSGLRVCTTVPDILYLPELVFGGLVWILVASTRVAMTSFLVLALTITVPNPLGWVMFVSVFCFVMTFLWLIIFASGGHKNSSSWAAADFLYHLIAVVFYLSASVILANETIAMKAFSDIAYPFKYYQMDIAAVVFSFIATLLYFIHCIFSAMRWKSF